MFSVVVPVYNAQDFIDRALLSILKQTYPPKEIILVDDGSTDNLKKKLDSYKNKIKYIYKDNGGVASARNIGINIAENEFIAFLDADDEWMPYHLERAKDILQQNRKIPWFCAAYNRYSTEKGLIRKVVCPDKLIKDRIVFDFFKAFEETELMMTGTVIVRKKIFYSIGLFDERKNRGEDTNMWLRIALKYPAVGYSKDIAATYWINKSSITMKQNRLTPSVLLQSLIDNERLAKTAEEQELIKPYIRKYVKKIRNLAIKSINSRVLRELENQYKHHFDIKTKLIIYFYKHIPYCIFDLIIKLRSKFIRW
jgi:glycosyltransferase involved in cell wall biosynthesis